MNKREYENTKNNKKNGIEKFSTVKNPTSLHPSSPFRESLDSPRVPDPRRASIRQITRVTRLIATYAYLRRRRDMTDYKAVIDRAANDVLMLARRFRF